MTNDKAQDSIDILMDKYTAESLVAQKQFLIYGGTGVGKTYAIRTARKPLLVHSFDPGGSIALADLVEKGEALVMDKYEHEDAFKPTAWAAWAADFDALVNNHVFDKVGTFILDSGTTWGTACMNSVLAQAKRPGTSPQQQDWYPQMTRMENAIKTMLGLPCDVVFLCHEDSEKDELTGRVWRSPLLTGKSKTRIMSYFSEVYYATVSRSAKGTEYLWQLDSDANIKARSRFKGLALAKNGTKVDSQVRQDFQAFMKEVGQEYEDKPPFVRS